METTEVGEGQALALRCWLSCAVPVEGNGKGKDQASLTYGGWTSLAHCRARLPDLDRWVSQSRLKGKEPVGAVSNRAYGNEFRDLAIPNYRVSFRRPG